MSVLDDFLAGYDRQSMDGGQVMNSPAPVAAPQAAAGPSILDILSAAQGTTQAPTLPQPSNTDMQGILPMALMRFAAQVTQPRSYGQGTFGKVLESGNNALEYADMQKRQLQQRAIDQEMARRKLAESEVALQGARLSNVAKAQGIEETAKRAPLELSQLEASVRKATSDATTAEQLGPLQIKVAAIKARYSEEMTQAELAEKNAKTDAERASAADRRAHASLLVKQADEYGTMLEAKKAQLARGTVTEKPADPITGMPAHVTVTKPGGVPQMHFLSPNDAESYAQAAVRSAKDSAKISGEKVDEKKVYAQAKAWALARVLGADGQPPMGDAPAGKAAGGVPGNPNVVPQDTKLYSDAQAYSASAPGEAFYLDLPKSKMRVYFIGGKEVSEAEGKARLAARGKAAPPPASGPSSTQPNVSIVQMGSIPEPGPRVAGPQTPRYTIGQ